MNQEQFNSAIAIYNPNGGHNAGKIYDVTPNSNDLTVSGGGGTRINKDGLVEEIPIRTNSEPWSYTADNYVSERGIIKTINQVGITGLPNTAMLLEDNVNDYSKIARAASNLSGGFYKYS